MFSQSQYTSEKEISLKRFWWNWSKYYDLHEIYFKRILCNCFRMRKENENDKEWYESYEIT